MSDAREIMDQTLEEILQEGKRLDGSLRALANAQANVTSSQAKVEEALDYARTLLKDHADEYSGPYGAVIKEILAQYGNPTQAVEAQPSQTTLSVESPSEAGQAVRKRFAPEEAEALVKAVLTKEGQKLAEIERQVHETEPGLTKSAMRNALGRLREAGVVVTEGRVAGMTYKLK